MVFISDTIADACITAAAIEPDRLKKFRDSAAHDAHLVGRFKDGDQAAFTEIVGRHRTRLLSVAYSRVWNHGDAEEVVQDTFIRAHHGLATFRGECSLSTWLHRVTLNLARNRYWYFHRRFRHATVSLNCSMGEDNPSTLLDIVACESAGPRRAAVTHEFIDLIAECMQRLDEPQRVILNLTHTMGYAEIAHQLGLNVGTVKSRIARARDRLHALLGAACPEFADDACLSTWLESTRARSGLSHTLDPR